MDSGRVPAVGACFDLHCIGIQQDQDVGVAKERLAVLSTKPSRWTHWVDGGRENLRVKRKYVTQRVLNAAEPYCMIVPLPELEDIGSLPAMICKNFGPK